MNIDFLYNFWMLTGSLFPVHEAFCWPREAEAPASSELSFLINVRPRGDWGRCAFRDKAKHAARYWKFTDRICSANLIRLVKAMSFSSQQIRWQELQIIETQNSVITSWLFDHLPRFTGCGNYMKFRPSNATLWLFSKLHSHVTDE